MIQSSNPGSSRFADAVFLNGKIWTVDDNNPLAEGIAVFDGRIVEVGSSQVIRNFIGPKTQVVDLGGRLALPGFIDSHTHFVKGGLQQSSIDLRKAGDEEEFSQTVKSWAEVQSGKWITGGDWDHEQWPGAPLPTKELIDPFTPETPVFVSRLDGHMALANSLALKVAGIAKDTSDPPGGTIVRNQLNGQPTGILKDEAMKLVWRVIPELTEDERVEAILRASEEAKKFGVTSVQDISTSEDVCAYQSLEREGKLTVRIFCRLPLSEWERVSGEGVKVPHGTEMVRLGSLKAFVDGSLGSSTALFFEPYNEDASNCGLAMETVEDGRLEWWAFAADRAGLQLSLHAIGDCANSWALDLFEKIQRENPPWDRRFRIEHAQHVHPRDFVRFAKLGVIVSAQPFHAIDDGRWVQKRLGLERSKTSYAYRAFLDHGVTLCFGSDWTVAPLNPLLGIYAAVTRRTLDGKNPEGWIPEQKISVQEAIAAYTIQNARAAFEESFKGSISPGKVADFVVLSEDILSVNPTRILDTQVDITVLGGRIIYQR